jgi:hypothetical protein
VQIVTHGHAKRTRGYTCSFRAEELIDRGVAFTLLSTKTATRNAAHQTIRDIGHGPSLVGGVCTMGSASSCRTCETSSMRDGIDLFPVHNNASFADRHVFPGRRTRSSAMREKAQQIFHITIYLPCSSAPQLSVFPPNTEMQPGMTRPSPAYGKLGCHPLNGYLQLYLAVAYAALRDLRRLSPIADSRTDGESLTPAKEIVIIALSITP